MPLNNPVGSNLPTFSLLDDIVTILGSTKSTFFPFLESKNGNNNDLIWSYKNNSSNLQSRDEAAAKALETEFQPYRHIGGVYSYEFSSAANQHLLGADDANTGFPSNADFSVGAWIWPRDITTVTVMSKYDVNLQREWRLQLDGSSKIELEVYDETNNQDRTGASDTAVTTNQWSFVVATTDNNDSSDSMTFYLNGSADGTGNTESGAAFANSPDTDAKLVVGATLNTDPAVTNLFSGRIALPFVCGKELTSANVASLYGIGQKLLGLT